MTKFFVPFKLIILFILFIATFPIYGQNIQKSGKKVYDYEGQKYRYADMGPVFETNKRSHELFLRARKKGKSAKAWGTTAWAGLGLIFIGGLVISTDSNTGTYRLLRDGPALTGILIALPGIIAFPVGGIIGLMQGSEARQLQRESVDVFNQSFDTSRLRQHKIEIGIILGPALGLSIVF